MLCISFFHAIFLINIFINLLMSETLMPPNYFITIMANFIFILTKILLSVMENKNVDETIRARIML